jgi:hypothetical protein
MVYMVVEMLDIPLRVLFLLLVLVLIHMAYMVV